VRANPGKTLYTATKGSAEESQVAHAPRRRAGRRLPRAYIREYAEKSLKNLGLPRVDLLQFHVWEDAWAAGQSAGRRAVDDLKREGLVRAIGISLNRWEPWNGIETLRTGVVDAVAGHLQHLRPGRRKTSCFPSAASSTSP